MESSMQQGDPLMALIMPLVMSLIYGIVIHFLAKEKGRKVALWTVLGFIPLVNIFLLPFFVGATNLRLEGKIDKLLSSQSK